MSVDKYVSEIDPSRYTVYQMLESTRQLHGSCVMQAVTDNLFLFRTEPFIDDLYNYAHVLAGKINHQDILRIREFFADQPYKIKAPDTEDLRTFIESQGFVSKSTGNIMVTGDVQETPYTLPQGVSLVRVRSESALADAKQIFAEAFSHTMQETQRKFGFLDSVILDLEDERMNVFVLYEDGVPASTGAYYAFDEFSIENIGTRPTFRKKGYAHAIMLCLLSEAARLKYARACLVASDAGARVYEGIGFSLLAKTRGFVER